MRRVLVAVQFSSNAQWGRGLYFARDAVSSADARGRIHPSPLSFCACRQGYSDFYATRVTSDEHGMRDDEREFMLVDLLLGDVIEIDVKW